MITKNKINKRGQLFTILGILLITLMFITIEIFSVIHERQAIKTRVATMNSFLDSIEKNLERQVYIAGFRIILLAEREITDSKNYIPNIDAFFEEAFYNGTVNGVPADLMNQATYADIISSINLKASKINVNISMTNTTIDLRQNDPWNLRVTMVSNFSMVDIGGLARWDKVQNISVLIPIQGFEDPLFTKETYAKVVKKINRTIYEGNYVNGNDVSNLRDHVDQGYYTNNTDAPSFLNRLEGNLSSDPNGIESFVYAPDLSGQGISIEDKSVVDHIYFDPGNNPAYHRILGMHGWFKIDDGHTARYNISSSLFV